MLECLQAKECCDVPDGILNIVKNDLREGCSMPIIKLIFKKKQKKKKNRLSSYYNNVPQIYCRITGAPPNYLSNGMEERIIYLLHIYCDHLKKYRPPKRKNFLSYSYVFFFFFLNLRI